MTTKIKSGVIGDNVVGITQLNVSDGTNGQVLITDGSGTLSFSTISGYTDSDVETYLNTSEIYTDATNNRLGIGTTSPEKILHIKTAVNNTAFARIESTATNSYPTLSLKNDAREYQLTTHGGVSDSFVIYDGTAGANRLVIDSSGNVGIGTTSPNAKLQVEEYGIDTTETSTTATTQVAIHTMSATTFRSARFTVQVTNSTDSTYHLTEILMIHDGTTPSITEYGTIFTGSAEATFDADISSGNVRLLATPASTDSMEFKVICHSITV